MNYLYCALILCTTLIIGGCETPQELAQDQAAAQSFEQAQRDWNAGMPKRQPMNINQYANGCAGSPPMTAANCSATCNAYHEWVTVCGSSNP